MIGWRLGTDAPEYTADDLAGTGAKLSGGRWNRKGTPLLYVASSRALACLETMVHFGVQDLPLNRYLVEIDLPDDLVAAAVRFDAVANVGWDAIPEGKVSLDAGDRWAKSGTSAIMIVPSVIVPEECNYLLNPLHPDAARVRARKVRRWVYDARLVPPQAPHAWAR